MGHKAVLVSCIPWLRHSDIDKVIMPGMETRKLKEAIKEFYLTGESKAAMVYFTALIGPCFNDGNQLKDLVSIIEIGDQKPYSIEAVKTERKTKEEMYNIVEETYENGYDFLMNEDSDAEQGYEPKNNKENVSSLSRNGTKGIKKSITCKRCDLTFETLASKKKHMKETHKSGTKTTNQNLKKCKFCGLVSETMNQNEKHMTEMHDFKYDCEICGQKLSGYSSAHRHRRIKHPDLYKINCDMCGCGFINKAVWLVHSKICKGSKAKNEHKKADHVCEECGKTLTSRNGLMTHMLLHNPEHGNHKCDECDKNFATEFSLRTHRKTQHEGKNNCFPCEVCGKVITSKKSLRDHIKRVHDKTMDRKCDQCDFSTTNNTDLKRHIESIHLGITYPCDQCEAVFPHYNYLYAHRLVHTSDRPFVCQKCGLSFKQKEKMKKHDLLVHSSTSFSCEECGKIFKCESYLAQHKRSHDEDSQFPCTFCERKFVTRTKLKMHINTHTGERPYKCTLSCGKAFYSSDQLSHHKKQCKDYVKPSEFCFNRRVQGGYPTN